MQCENVDCPIEVGTSHYENDTIAVQKWNTRVQPIPDSALIEKLEAERLDGPGAYYDGWNAAKYRAISIIRRHQASNDTNSKVCLHSLGECEQTETPTIDENKLQVLCAELAYHLNRIGNNHKGIETAKTLLIPYFYITKPTAPSLERCAKAINNATVQWDHTHAPNDMSGIRQVQAKACLEAAGVEYVDN